MSENRRDNTFETEWQAPAFGAETTEPEAPSGPTEKMRALHRALLASWRLYLEDAIDEHPEQARRALARELLDQE